MIVFTVIGAFVLVLALLLAILYALFRLVAPWLRQANVAPLPKWKIALLVPPYLFDMAMNRTVVALLTWDRAQEPTVTLRMKRYLWLACGKRLHLARAVCEVLNKYVPGHCGCGETK